ncbi:hypothetical protein, partial [Anaerobacillus alkalilacustris]|uniref:hypothetical protein n=1 Tax=Anaerobacillus alkalilacustris TaxID=393763 RepID=UPI001B80C98E
MANVIRLRIQILECYFEATEKVNVFEKRMIIGGQKCRPNPQTSLRSDSRGSFFEYYFSDKKIWTFSAVRVTFCFSFFVMSYYQSP